MRLLFSLALIILLSACSDLGYYWHTTKGHFSIMNQRVSIDAMLEDPELSENLRQRLILVQKIRVFSNGELSLGDSGSYTSYVQLDRPYVLQNLFAAKEFSTQLHHWCYPIVGCASYRGYYDEERLNDYVSQLRAENFDIYIGYVPAYSTLGWFDDPVLSSFIDWPDYRLAGLLFHELTHQRVYIDDDTEFNESLASAVQQAGTGLWLKSLGDDTQLAEFRHWIEYRLEVLLLIEQTREKLNLLYQTGVEDALKRDRKQAIFSLTRENYAAIAKRFNYKDGFEDWFAGELNNAKLGSVSAYNTHVASFLSIIKAMNYDFSAFFDAIEKIAAMNKVAREQCLISWMDSGVIDHEYCP